MSDMPCICQMGLLDENIQNDFLAGRGLEILFGLMDGLKTKRELATKLSIPIYSVELYLQRLIKANLVVEGETQVCGGQMMHTYHLTSTDIEIINQLQCNEDSEVERKRKAEISAQHFAIMTRNAIKSVNLHEDKPNRIRAYFMKAKKEDMEAFRNEIEQLFEKYKALEDCNAEDTYSLFTVLAPYNVED